ncbi:coiled-coil domain-containing protein 186 [Tetranychus urticae]|uniref:coiled-coil domain-containing protein 186 n=1 Tax=Tetranychus urticae TaxID=32264 RepID=UPI00077BCB4B|nr:coiled-coil domain-containing protein 186 [Tetranychus urticae]
MAEDNEPSVSCASLDTKTTDEETNQLSFQTTSNQPLTFDDVCLANKERSSTPSSHSSQEVGLSGSSTPLGTPFHASNESLIKDLLGYRVAIDDDDDDAMTSAGSRSTHNEITDGFLLDLKNIEANYEAKVAAVVEEKNDLEKQLIELKEKFNHQEEEFKKTVEDIKLTFNSRLEKCTKERDVSRKDLESMVVKYAKSERDVIVYKKAKDEAERKSREAVKEKESLVNKVKSLTCDKNSLVKSVETKLSENILLQKEIEKIREELKDRDQKWKQTQSKLAFEISDHHETCKKLGSALALIETLQNKTESSSDAGLTNDRSRSSSRNEMIGENTNVNDNTSTAVLPSFSITTSEENDETKESNSEQKSDSEKTNESKDEHKVLRNKCISLESENHSLTRKIQALERERLDHEEVVSKLKESLNKLNGEVLECNLKLKDMEELKINLQHQKEMVESAKTELSRVTELNSELTTEMESCRHKEGELLEFTERLTAKSVLLQAEHNALEEKYSALLEKFNFTKKRLQEFEKENTVLTETLAKERDDHEKEIKLMARKVAEKMELITKYKTRVEEIENENKVMKKRHLNSIRELNKELLIMKKHMETCENEQSTSTHRKENGNHNSDTVSNSSRSSTSSNDASTSKGNTLNIPNISNSDMKSVSSANGSTSSTSVNDDSLTNKTGETDLIPHVDKTMLINKIFRLQKTIAKKQEKIDYLEEHNHQLLSEMKKKTKLIQYYILREESGALTTNRMDENKKQLAKHGSTVMTSLYKSYPTDSAMTLNLSLEINKRLQAVLEDTILKNITLKENLNTLGEEIARLMQQRNSPDRGASTKAVTVD